MNGVWKKGPAGDLFEALEKVHRLRMCCLESQVLQKQVPIKKSRRLTCM